MFARFSQKNRKNSKILVKNPFCATSGGQEGSWDPPGAILNKKIQKYSKFWPKKSFFFRHNHLKRHFKGVWRSRGPPPHGFPMHVCVQSVGMATFWLYQAPNHRVKGYAHGEQSSAGGHKVHCPSAPLGSKNRQRFWLPPHMWRAHSSCHVNESKNQNPMV